MTTTFVIILSALMEYLINLSPELVDVTFVVRLTLSTPASVNQLSLVTTRTVRYVTFIYCHTTQNILNKTINCSNFECTSRKYVGV